MNRSDGIGALAAALAKAQASIPPIKRDKTARINSDKGGYSYSYADLATIMDAIREPLATNGLAVLQTVETGDGLVVVETMLAHSSGEWISHQIGLQARGDARTIGSAITYARRYGLSITGVVTEDDDDGERTSGGATSVPRRQQPAPKRQPEPTNGHDERDTSGWDGLQGGGTTVKAEPEKPAGHSRPFPPEIVKQKLARTVESAPADLDVEKAHKGGFVALRDLFGDDEDVQHAAIFYLFGKNQRRDVIAAEWDAIRKWSDARQNDAGEWIPSQFAIDEAKGITAMLAEKAQATA